MSNERLPENVSGRWYTTNACIDCDLCRETAPSVFQRNDDIGMTVVVHQPATPEEEQQTREAMDACPVEAIRFSE